MPQHTRPTLPQLKTPASSTFPSELSALSARSPLPRYAEFLKTEDGIKTPITPPLAYTEFLKSVSSPAITGGTTPRWLSGRSTPTSAVSSTTPSTASTEHSTCSCKCEIHKPASKTSETPPATPVVHPTSAPLPGPKIDRPAGAFLQIPASPAYSMGTPMSASARSSAMRSPFAAPSPFDWDFRSRNSSVRPWDVNKPGVRQVREVVTRTITYTPRMSPAPKGKRRKLSKDSE